MICSWPAVSLDLLSGSLTNTTDPFCTDIASWPTIRDLTTGVRSVILIMNTFVLLLVVFMISVPLVIGGLVAFMTGGFGIFVPSLLLTPYFLILIFIWCRLGLWAWTFNDTEELDRIKSPMDVMSFYLRLEALMEDFDHNRSLSQRLERTLPVRRSRTRPHWYTLPPIRGLVIFVLWKYVDSCKAWRRFKRLCKMKAPDQGHEGTVNNEPVLVPLQDLPGSASPIAV